MSGGGRIITIGSALADRVPAPGMTLYAMAQSALTGLTRAWPAIWAPADHRLPGTWRADRHRHEPCRRPAASFLSSIPALGRYGGAEGIAALVTHLAGDGGRYVTGAAVSVDGGFAA